MHKFDPYIARPTKFIDQIDTDGWRIKVYGISVNSLPLPNELTTEGIRYVLSHLPQPAVSEQRYGVGFLIVHHGSMRNWFLLNWWEKGDIVHHILFSSPLDNPGAISAEPDRSLVACVHELRVMNFESEAWIKTVLRRDNNPSLENYLKSRLDSDDDNSQG